ncbi:MAG: bifunctional aminotransferase class I/II-fold pyridoxal phosphate-dependent enzyme/GNAT family N-acetyltransferase [Bacteroidota bacterium]
MFDTLNQIIEDGFQRNLVHNYSSSDTEIPKSSIMIDQNEMVNFGSCSYLALEKNEELQKGVIQAVSKYGTQFSSSRGYLSIDLYKELENFMFQIFERPVIVSASTTLGHLATIPVLVGKNDAVILDLQVHSSIQMTVQQLKAKKIPIHIIRHNCMESLEKQIKSLSNKYDKIWFFADGVYSMYGDYAPFEKLDRLLAKYDKFHVYIDDAHGMGWAGKNGCGIVHSKMKNTDKLVLIVSLNKSFASAGGCIVFPNSEMQRKVRNCGPTYLFCGPIQPPMLGAAIASAKIHLSPQLQGLQDKLHDLIAFANAKLDELGLPQYKKTNSPVFFIPVGLPKICYDIVSKMKTKGFFVNTASFPVVPMRKSGVRFMINNFLSKDQIDLMLTALCEVYAQTMIEHNNPCTKIAKTFSIPAFTLKINSNVYQESVEDKLQISYHRSIKELDKKEWNATFFKNGTLSYSNLELIENLYTKEVEAENNWKFYYLCVNDHSGKCILKTLITVALVKDDMFHPGYVSKKIEDIRNTESPYFLTSKTVITGTLITKGNHVYINFKSRHWKKALSVLTDYLNQLLEETNSTKIMIRDFYGAQDMEFETEMLEKGFTKFQLPNTMEMKNMHWKSREEYLQALPQKYRYNVRKEIIKYEPSFAVAHDKPRNDEEIIPLYQLYENVYHKSYDLNVFKLPYTYFRGMCDSDEYDIIRLYLKESAHKNDTKSKDKLVAVMFSHIHQDVYNAMIVGLDYEYVYSHKTYKQILYRTMVRARSLNCQKLDLAFTAELEKKKLGARPKEVFAYVQASEHLKESILEYV